MEIPTLLPLLPIRNAVVFPGASMPLVVGRPRSIGAMKKARDEQTLIVVSTQRVMSQGDPSIDDINRIGVVCKIENVIETDNGAFQVVVTGISRYRIAEFLPNDQYMAVRGETVADIHSSDPIRTQALFNSLKSLAKEILTLFPGPGEQLSKLVEKVDDPSQLANMCGAYLNLSTPQKQELLEETMLDQRMEKLLSIMHKEKEVLSVQKNIQEKLSERLSKTHREALLREQLRTIKEELGEEGSASQDEIRKKLDEAKLPEEARKIADEEIKRLDSLPPAAAEYHVIRTYLDWLASMPWSKSTNDEIDLKKAREILDEDHYGLEQVKKRILQYLAVAKLKNDLAGPILCLVGPPGVGKTSLGQSIAKAVGRKFVRCSLGGVRDESEIRGHRRTYIGAMPGRIVQSIKRAGVNNPLFMLDEIDKLGQSFHGDPSAALLEVLDPEQNDTFTDHYLDVPFDLSNAFFIATANVIDTIPAPLRDRMEIIDISGYTTSEKLSIAKKYLLPKQLKDHGLTDQNHIEIPDETIQHLISHYTREAGVRELNRKVASLCRAAAEEVVLNQMEKASDTTPPKVVIDTEKARKILGKEKFHPEEAYRGVRPGVVTGLAWTPTGGDILFIEATSMPGNGRLTITGQLGDVMKESAQIAMSLTRSVSANLNKLIDFDKQDFHIHVPSGAIPKDGPSAGVALLTTLASLITEKTVDPKLAMTGEITLRGAVLPVGGIKEKLLGAHRAGIKKILLPKKNQPDVSEIPEEVLNKLDITYVESIEEVLSIALGMPVESFKTLPFILKQPTNSDTKNSNVIN